MGVLGTILLVFISVHMSQFWAQYHFGHIPFAQYDINETTGAITKNSHEPIDTKKAEYALLDNDGSVIGKTVIVKDLQQMVEVTFKNFLFVLLYVISMFALAFHLIHGFKSAFQSLGINHPKYNGIINFTGVLVFGIIIPLGFVSMPIYFFLK
jgi:succinate dehydrogenase / fumarate reductase cytochrome b subunit